MKKIALTTLLTLFALSSLIVYVYGSETITVSPMGEMIRTVTLNSGDKVNGTCSVNQGSASYGTLMIMGPDKSVLFTSTIIGTKTIPFSFSAHTSGEYKIDYWNMGILSSARVTLDYTAPSQLAGMFPIILPVAVILLILALGGFLIYSSRGRRKNSVQNITPILPNQPDQTSIINEPNQIYANKSEIKCGKCGTMNDIDANFCKKCANNFQ